MTLPLDIRHCQDDIQALVASAFSSLRQCHYLFLHVQDPARARAWIGARLRDGLVKSVADLGVQRRHQSAVALSFTYAGLAALGLEETRDLPFASLFKSGMADVDRANLFGDRPAQWHWGDVEAVAPPPPPPPPPPAPPTAPAPPRAAPTGAAQSPVQVHLLAVYFAADGATLPGCLTKDSLLACGLAAAIKPVASCPAYIQPETAGGTKSYEPFGFRDGISQPAIRGLRETRADTAARLKAGDLYEDRVVAPGEFLFGHANEYGEVAAGPNAQWQPPGRRNAGTSFGLNGSFMVVRQYRQKVDAFEHYVQMQDPTPHYAAPAAHAPAAHPPGCPARPAPQLPSAAEKMIGRMREGAPLVPAHAAPTEENAFRYRLDDATGFACPRGAHVRRANPRDLLGWDVESGVVASKLHRLLRRGRTWTDGCKGGAGDGNSACGNAAHRLPQAGEQRCGAGLMFIALNADLERQYEFVQQQWLMNQKFSDLYDEADPILATSADGTRHFSVPAVPAGKKLNALPDFTEVIGGGYFFLPGIAALHFIAQGPAAPESCGPTPPLGSP